MAAETELKLEVPPAALPALRRHPLLRAGRPLGPPRRLRNTYYETASRALQARRIALRVRSDGQQRLLTVKGRGSVRAGLATREEWECPYTGHLDFAHVDDAALRRQLERLKPQLAPLFSTDFQRETRRLRTPGGAQLLVMIDHGHVRSGKRRVALSELELELVSGPQRELTRLARKLARDLPLVPSDISKAQRGLLLAGSGARVPLMDPPPRRPAPRHALEAFTQLAGELLAQWQAGAVTLLREGAGSPLAIHDLRVALRRLRSLLRLFAPALPAGFARRWRCRLGQTARGYEQVRDLDVLLAALDDSAHAPTPALLALRRHAHAATAGARERLGATPQLRRQGESILSFSLALQRLGSTLREDRRYAAFARRRTGQLARRARRRLHRAADARGAPLHRLRIAVKDLRYAVEFFSPLPLKADAQALARAQRELGRVQDLRNARRQLRQWARESPRLAAAATALAAQYRGAQKAAAADALKASRLALRRR